MLGVGLWYASPMPDNNSNSASLVYLLSNSSQTVPKWERRFFDLLILPETKTIYKWQDKKEL